jgi:glutathione S-transferase
VDAFFAPVTFRALTYGLDFGDVGNVYADMLRKQPAMREWYEAGLAETWREQGHEDEILASGPYTADYRAVAIAAYIFAITPFSPSVGVLSFAASVRIAG